MKSSNDTLNNLPTTSRVWVYQADRELSTTESEELEKLGSEFVQQWASHGNKLIGAFEVHHNRFSIITVDESQAGASGCSIDTSVHFMQEMEQHFDTTFFDRMVLYYINTPIRTCSPNDHSSTPKVLILDCTISNIPQLIKSGELTKDTIIFDNTIQTKAELDSRWQVKMGESWAERYF